MRRLYTLCDPGRPCRCLFASVVMLLLVQDACCYDETQDCVTIATTANCSLNITNDSLDKLKEALVTNEARFVTLNPVVKPFFNDANWRYHDRDNEFGKYLWVWVDGNIGKGYLHLPYDFKHLSLGALASNVDHVNIFLYEEVDGCWRDLNVTEKFCTVSHYMQKSIEQINNPDNILENSFLCYNNYRVHRLPHNFVVGYRCSDSLRLLQSKKSLIFYNDEAGRQVNDIIFEVCRIIVIVLVMCYSPSLIFRVLPACLTEIRSEKMLKDLNTYVYQGLYSYTPLQEWPYVTELATKTWVIRLVRVVTYVVAHIVLIVSTILSQIGLYHFPTPLSFYFEHPVWIVLVVLFGFGGLFIIFAVPILAFQNDVHEENKCRSCSCRFRVRANIAGTSTFFYKDFKPVCDYCDCCDGCSRCCKSIRYIVIFRLPVVRCFIALVVWCFRAAFQGDIKCKTVRCIALEVALIIYFLYWETISFFTLLVIFDSIVCFLTGLTVNSNIVLPIVIIVLSGFYCLWFPVHLSQEKYRTLRDIVFDECRSRVEITVDSGKKFKLPNEFENENDEGANQSNSCANQSSNEERNQSKECKSPNEYGEKNQEKLSKSKECCCMCRRKRASDNRPVQSDKNIIKIYDCAVDGSERIPRDLWVLIYSKLLPYNNEVRRIVLTAVITVSFVTLFTLILAEFGEISDFPIIGPSIASLVTVSLPSLILIFINIRADKHAMKQKWKVASKIIVQKYIEQKEPDETTGKSNTDSSGLLTEEIGPLSIELNNKQKGTGLEAEQTTAQSTHAVLTHEKPGPADAGRVGSMGIENEGENKKRGPSSSEIYASLREQSIINEYPISSQQCRAIGVFERTRSMPSHASSSRIPQLKQTLTHHVHNVPVSSRGSLRRSPHVNTYKKAHVEVDIKSRESP